VLLCGNLHQTGSTPRSWNSTWSHFPDSAGDFHCICASVLPTHICTASTINSSYRSRPCKRDASKPFEEHVEKCCHVTDIDTIPSSSSCNMCGKILAAIRKSSNSQMLIVLTHVCEAAGSSEVAVWSWSSRYWNSGLARFSGVLTDGSLYG
jgi:hypothetical protein